MENSSDRSKKRYIDKANQCLDLVFNTICPGEGETLKTALLSSEKDEDVTLETLVSIYQRAETWMFQRQILSIICIKHKFEEVKKVCPLFISLNLYNFDSVCPRVS